VARPAAPNLMRRAAAALAFFLVALAFLGWSEWRFFEVRAWRTHNREILNQIGSVRELLLDGETGQRGFLLTGDAAYMEPFLEARRDFPRALAQLRALTRDEPSQGTYDALESAVRAKLADLERVLAIRQRSNLEEALAAERAGDGLRLMRQAEEILDSAARQQELRLRDGDDRLARITVLAGVAQWLLLGCSVVLFVSILGALRRSNAELARLLQELQDAVAEVKTLSGMLPICAACKNVRDDKGYWSQIEIYIRDHSEAEFSHSICPDCAQRLYPEYYQELFPPGPVS
jgi:CHASE3 domain sensor protein